MLDVYIFYKKKKKFSKLFCHDAKKNYDIYSTYNILKGNNDYTLSRNLHTCTEAGGFFFSTESQFRYTSRQVVKQYLHL